MAEEYIAILGGETTRFKEVADGAPWEDSRSVPDGKEYVEQDYRFKAQNANAALDKANEKAKGLGLKLVKLFKELKLETKVVE